MITYSVKKNNKSRITFRVFGIFLVLFGGMQIAMFLKGYAADHKFGTVICLLLAIYGVTMIMHSFRKQSYDIKYEFDENEVRIFHYRGVTTYKYDELKDCNMIVPDNEEVYCLLHLVAKKEKFLIPFSYKKEACNRIYTLVTAGMTSMKIKNDAENS